MARNVWTDRIDTSIRFFIYTLILWLPYSSAMVEACVILSLVFWIVKRMILWRERRSDGERGAFAFLRSFVPVASPLNPYIYFFLLVCLFSVAGSAFPEIALRGFLTKTLEWFIIYWLVCETFTRPKHLRIALTVFLITTTVVCLDSFIQYYMTGKDIFNGRTLANGRATASFQHGNSLGAYLTFSVPFIAGLVGAWPRKRMKIFTTMVTFCGLWSIFLTYSRASWLAMGVGVCLLTFLWRRSALWVAMVFLIGAGCFYILTHPVVQERFRLTSDSVAGAAQWRTNLWLDSFAMIRDRPLFGHGINLYMRLFQEYRRKLADNYDFEPTYAHNSFVQLACETGLLGLAGMLAFLAAFFRTVVAWAAEAGRRKDVFLQRFFVAGAGGTLGFLVHSFFDVDFYSLQLSALFWVMTGIIISSGNVLNGTDIYDKNIT